MCEPHSLPLLCLLSITAQWDIIAGLSVGFMVVPQAMSYAAMVGLPSVFGLYGAFAAPMAYSLFGSSRELAIGPVAITSLLISAALKDLVPGSADIVDPQHPEPDQVRVGMGWGGGG